MQGGVRAKRGIEVRRQAREANYGGTIEGGLWLGVSRVEERGEIRTGKMPVLES